MDDYYKTLGVSKTASQDEIRKAYRKLAKELHPDANPGDEVAEERFKKVSEAFNTLSDKDKRSEYDTLRAGGFAGAGAGGFGSQQRGPFNFRQSRQGGRGFDDIGDIFSDLFTDFGQAGPNAAPKKGPDVRQSLTISFADAATGGKHRVKLPSGRSVDVSVPAGANDGQVLRLRSQGQAAPGGGQAGDLLIEVSVAEHRFFSRDGDNVRLDLPVSLQEAALGAKVRVPTIDGKVEVQIPPGSSSGSLLRLRGKGFAKSKGGRGDQIVKLLVALPERDEALKSFLETWSPSGEYNPRKGLDV